MQAIQTDNLTKYYGHARGIEGLDLEVEAGEFFGFIGPNGAGKSTTIRTLLGLIAPTGGSARVLGLDICTQRQAILRQVGYLPAEAFFYPGQRVRDVLRLSAGLRRKDCTAAARELCRRLQLDTNAKVDALSFGNRKKVGIVCALQHDPALLILDEPTGGLDPLMQREFFTILRERNAAGATVFLSSHILSEVQRHCTRAGVIRDGRLIACGKVEDLADTGARRVLVRGNPNLSRLPGVRGLEHLEDGVRFLYSGSMQPLLQTLAAAPVRDVQITEPDLEEVFLHYYTQGGDPA